MSKRKREATAQLQIGREPRNPFFAISQQLERNACGNFFGVGESELLICTERFHRYFPGLGIRKGQGPIDIEVTIRIVEPKK